jgi:hypothetical protein
MSTDHYMLLKLLAKHPMSVEMFVRHLRPPIRFHGHLRTVLRELVAAGFAKPIRSLRTNQVLRWEITYSGRVQIRGYRVSKA